MDLSDLRLVLANSRDACKDQAIKFKRDDSRKWNYCFVSWENLELAYNFAIDELEKTDEWQNLIKKDKKS